SATMNSSTPELIVMPIAAAITDRLATRGATAADRPGPARSAAPVSAPAGVRVGPVARRQAMSTTPIVTSTTPATCGADRRSPRTTTASTVTTAALLARIG